MKKNPTSLALLKRLVAECTPLCLPTDARPAGTQAPSKQLLEEARAYIASPGRRGRRVGRTPLSTVAF